MRQETLLNIWSQHAAAKDATTNHVHYSVYINFIDSIFKNVLSLRLQKPSLSLS